MVIASRNGANSRKVTREIALGEYSATIRWQRGEQPFADDQYSRTHLWEFDGGLKVPASASPQIVPLPYSDADNVDPEEAFVASLSSCHMLFFLSLAARQGIIVDTYLDHAVGCLGKDEQGRMAMLSVNLRPQASYSGNVTPTPRDIDELHHRSHALCFIANSVKTEVAIEIVS